nr:stability determinant [Verminephrobacter aporrectodeae]
MDPRVSEFETQQQADSYDRWFRVKVQEAIESERPSLPHDAAIARVDALLDEMRAKRAAH